MKVVFLGQGFLADTDNAVGTIIEKLFSEDVYHTFTGITAFASEAGVYGLSNSIADSISIKNINLIVGIDQEGTPKDALEELLKLNVNSYIFYQKEAPIFHPKIYLFEGDTKTTIIVGSSNLTGRGLFNNVESSTLIEFDNADADGKAYLIAMKDYYSTLFDYSDANLFKITLDIIQNFVDLKVVPTKRVWLNKQGKKKIEGEINDKIVIPPRKIANLPQSFRKKPKAKEMVDTSAEEIFAVSQDVIVSNLTEVWKSKPLTERDLNIPTGANTNPTGSMLLKKGLMTGIDHRDYFRNSVFADLNWQPHPNPAYTHLEKSSAIFEIKIGGNSMGTFNLTINHNKAIDTTAYKQNNAMTNLSWGSAKATIAKPELLGKTLTLFRDNNSVNQFIIEIQ